MFTPVVQSTEKSPEAITNELVPLREEMKHLNENLLLQAARAAARLPKKRKLDTVLDTNQNSIVNSMTKIY